MKHLYQFMVAFTSAANLFIPGLHAQVGILNGKVTDSGTGNGVEYVYVYNYSRQEQTYSNMKGEFKLEASEGDTLVLYGIGYFYKKMIVVPGMLSDQQLHFTLDEQPVELAEARIPVIGSYPEFRRKFVSMNREETPTEVLNESLAALSKNVAMEAYQEAQNKRRLEGVTLYSANIYTPEEKERLKLAGIKQKEQVRDQVYQKFNPQVVKNITGITSDEEIIEFMIFCKFTDAYILNVNEYDLAATISFKYELFRKKKEDERLMQNPLNFMNEIYPELASR